MRWKEYGAIVFDFGNTLCPWDEAQYQEVTAATMERLCRYIPGCNLYTVQATYANVHASNSSKCIPLLRENSIPKTLSDTAVELRGTPLIDSEIDDVIDAHTQAFVGVCTLPDGLSEMLTRLSERYRLGLLSNYPISKCIRLSLKALGIDSFFNPTIVSADLGIIKPSVRLFEALISKLSLPANQILFVGDDWIADIIGAHASGMPSVHISSGWKNRNGAESTFGTYLCQALQSPEMSHHAEAKPLVSIGSVFELEGWLKTGADAGDNTVEDS